MRNITSSTAPRRKARIPIWARSSGANTSRWRTKASSGGRGVTPRAGEAPRARELDRRRRFLAAPHRDPANLGADQSARLRLHGPVAGGEIVEAREAVPVAVRGGERRAVAFPPLRRSLAPRRDPNIRDRRVAVRGGDPHRDRARAVERHHPPGRALPSGEL